MDFVTPFQPWEKCGLQIEPKGGTTPKKETQTPQVSSRTGRSPESPRATDHSDEEFSVLLQTALRSRLRRDIEKRRSVCRSRSRRRAAEARRRRRTTGCHKRHRDDPDADGTRITRAKKMLCRELLDSNSGTTSSSEESSWPTGSTTLSESSGPEDTRPMDPSRIPKKP